MNHIYRVYYSKNNANIADCTTTGICPVIPRIGEKIIFYNKSFKIIDVIYELKQDITAVWVYLD